MHSNILARLRSRLGAENGATATEYVLLLIGVALVVIVGALVLGNAVSSQLSEVGTEVNEATIPNLP
jgi:Flp pilus assembly pilin Flp